MDTSPHLSGQPGNDTARLEVAALIFIMGKMMSMRRTDAPCMVTGKSGAVQPHPERTSIFSAVPATGRHKRWHRGVYSGSQNLFGSDKNSEAIHSQVKRCGRNPFCFFPLYACIYTYCAANIFWTAFLNLGGFFLWLLLGDPVEPFCSRKRSRHSGLD